MSTGGERRPRRDPRRRVQGRGGDRTLGGGEFGGVGPAKTVAEEDVAELVGLDVEINAGRTVGLGEGDRVQGGRYRGVGVVAQVAAGELRAQRARALTGVGGEGGDVDQGSDVGVTGGRVRDDGPAVGVADQDHGSANRLEVVGEVTRFDGTVVSRLTRSIDVVSGQGSARPPSDWMEGMECSFWLLRQ
jgi:hypothetical protein